MAAAKKKPANGRRKKTEPELVFEDGYWYIVNGKEKTNVGRSERHARRLLVDA